MISHKYKCIFVHIPKCAGTSVEKAFDHFDASQSRGRQDHRSVRMIEKPLPLIKAISNSENIKDSVRRFREYFRKQSNPNNGLTVSSEQYQNYFKFTFVRNPWDRAYSWYKNAMRDEIHQKNYGISADISFAEFITEFAGTGYLRPQTYWLENYSGNVDMNFIGKFENLTADFNKLCELLNVPDKSLPHLVKADKTQSLIPEVDNQTIDFISRFYAKEIELFDYDFDRDASLIKRQTIT